MPDRPLPEITGPALAGLEGYGREGALLGRRARRPEGAPQRLHGRDERVQHRLVAHLGAAQLGHGGDPGAERLGQPLPADVLLLAQRLAGAAQQRPVQRSRSPAHGGDQLPPGGDEHRTRRGGRLLRQELRHGGEPALQIDPVVGVTDRRVQLGEPVGLPVDGRGRRLQPAHQELRAVRLRQPGHLSTPFSIRFPIPRRSFIRRLTGPSAARASARARPTGAGAPRPPRTGSPSSRPCRARSRSCRPASWPPESGARRAPAAPRR